MSSALSGRSAELGDAPLETTQLPDRGGLAARPGAAKRWEGSQLHAYSCWLLRSARCSSLPSKKTPSSTHCTSAGLKSGFGVSFCTGRWRQAMQPGRGSSTEGHSGCQCKGGSSRAQKAPPGRRSWSYLHPEMGSSKAAVLSIQKPVPRRRWSLEMLLQPPSPCFVSPPLGWHSAPPDELPSIVRSSAGFSACSIISVFIEYC